MYRLVVCNKAVLILAGQCLVPAVVSHEAVRGYSLLTLRSEYLSNKVVLYLPHEELVLNMRIQQR